MTSSSSSISTGRVLGGLAIDFFGFYMVSSVGAILGLAMGHSLVEFEGKYAAWVHNTYLTGIVYGFLFFAMNYIIFNWIGVVIWKGVSLGSAIMGIREKDMRTRLGVCLNYIGAPLLATVLTIVATKVIL